MSSRKLKSLRFYYYFLARRRRYLEQRAKSVRPAPGEPNLDTLEAHALKMAMELMAREYSLPGLFR